MRSSSKVTQGPENTCSASSKLRPCLTMFFRFFASSHSYFIHVLSYCNSFCSYWQGSEQSKALAPASTQAVSESSADQAFQGDRAVLRVALHHFFDVLGDHVHFQVDRVAAVERLQVGHF